MKNLVLITLNVFVCVLLMSFYSYSQSLEIVQSGNKNFIIEKNNSGIIRIIPVSGSENLYNHLTNPAVENSNHNLLSPNELTSYNWTLKFSAPGKVFKDVSFADSQNGYIVTELGAVYKSTNGGNNWTSVMNLGFPYYWYGVDALSPDTVVISGFNNQGDINSGVIRWTFDGGSTWTNDIILHAPISGVGWLTRIHFFNSNMGIVSAEFSGGMYYTTNGGKDSSSWTYVQVNSDLGWFAGNIDADADGNVFTPGIHFAHSIDYGVTWTSGPSVDGTFDGGVDFIDNNLQYGMTGGGQISAPVSGWIHKTSDGGITWSGRLNFPFPIRSLKYFSNSLAFAFGGNVYQDSGGIYSSIDEGTTWNLDISTGAEMFSYDSQPVSSDSADVWSVGSSGGTSGFTGKLYKTRIAFSSIPVELTSFTANVNGRNVVLNWTTATETNNNGFGIQRSTGSGFSTIGFIHGSGTTTDPHNYTFEDKDLEPGNYFYRLKQIDLDGSYKFYSTVNAEIKTPDTYRLFQNYPNPFNPSTTIAYQIPKESFVTLKVYDVIGNEIADLVSGNQPAGIYKVEFNAQNLSSGMYFYKIKTENFVQVRKMLLMK